MKKISNLLLHSTNSLMEWSKAIDNLFYDTPHQVLTKALFNSGRVHTPLWTELFTFEKRYIQKMVNKSYGF